MGMTQKEPVSFLARWFTDSVVKVKSTLRSESLRAPRSKVCTGGALGGVESDEGTATTNGVMAKLLSVVRTLVSRA